VVLTGRPDLVLEGMYFFSKMDFHSSYYQGWVLSDDIQNSTFIGLISL
jgi:hypothetical protein